MTTEITRAEFDALVTKVGALVATVARLRRRRRIADDFDLAFLEALADRVGSGEFRAGSVAMRIKIDPTMRALAKAADLTPATVRYRLRDLTDTTVGPFTLTRLGTPTDRPARYVFR